MALNLDYVAKYAESLMVDECMIVRKGRQEDTLPGTWNETTGKYTKRTNESVVYEGKCMFYTRRVDATPVTEGGQQIASQQKYVSLPRDSELEIKPEDELTVTEVHAEGDQSLLGKTFFLEAMNQDTYFATRELSLVDKNSRMRT